jgi:hypothetical protein
MALSLLTAEDLTCSPGSGNSRTPAHNSCWLAVFQDRFRSLPARSDTIRYSQQSSQQQFFTVLRNLIH